MNSVVIVAAGKGTRFGPDRDKLFIEVLGLPVVAHTWRRFDAHPEVDETILVIRPELRDAFEEIATQLAVRKPYRFAAGGAERQDSVWNGLEKVSPSAALVAIHDAARPCVTPQVIADCFAAARSSGAAVAAQPVTDTIKESHDGATVAKHLDRSRLWAVQTPQTFQVAVIRRALSAVRQRGIPVTDDTAACELIGQAVRLVPSLAPNPKVTVPADVPYIELLLAAHAVAHPVR
ncbi:MAG: 2-C-methyl-D-erythritol 4-phosphate cytidylyltransferase [Verrucomicrobia bacterium]|nr:2-C-methyl-D-erythritol 4-phosphate cytidylyltransferase [Verrucomicrobiota bacterium]MBI3869100.1 2-C-methyl-D-erythritol 4-phosphate cytidylyltransferase [Verrucomicrobiota bacterium]